jgi:hypothetical protein
VVIHFFKVIPEYHSYLIPRTVKIRLVMCDYTKRRDGDPPSRLQCSPTGMHGLNLAPWTAARFLLCSPPPPLGDCGSKLGSPSADSPGRSRRLEAAFHSPAPTARFQAAATGSTFPAYFFGCRAEPSRGPFGPKLPARLSFDRRTGS